MQLPAETELWLRVFTFAVPSLTTILVGFLTFLWFNARLAKQQLALNKELENHKRELGERLEDYKKGISLELENHKFQLQSNFQKRFYEFQTRYNLFHQKRAEAIEKLFGFLAIVQNDLQNWAYYEHLERTETIDGFYGKMKNHLDELGDHFDQKRIYFDEDIKKYVLELVQTTYALLGANGTIESARRTNHQAGQRLKEQAANIIGQNIHPIMRLLEERIRQVLSAEPVNFEIAKRQ